MNSLAIIGGGPKALAVAVKNKVLRELGFKVPAIHIFEQHQIAANWQGQHGYTNGDLPLGTSPEKDLVFPYATHSDDKVLNRKINHALSQYSWQAFLTEHQRYAQWIDRGRPAPKHSEFASYLQWVANQVSDHCFFHFTKVKQIHLEQQLWQVQSQQGDTLSFSSLMLTGPGKTAFPIPLPYHKKILNTQNFWPALPKIIDDQPTRIAIIGAGENAASMLYALSKQLSCAIDVICPQGMIYSRGESYLENRVYSSPRESNWQALSAQQRRQFIARTDRGVFSQQAQAFLNGQEGINVICGKPKAVIVNHQHEIIININNRQHHYDYVVIATGGDQEAYCRELLTEKTIKAITEEANLEQFKATHIEKNINHFLALEGLTPALFIPALAGLNQGPGFANLSCLGLLADRVHAYFNQKSQINLSHLTQSVQHKG